MEWFCREKEKNTDLGGIGSWMTPNLLHKQLDQLIHFGSHLNKQLLHESDMCVMSAHKRLAI